MRGAVGDRPERLDRRQTVRRTLAFGPAAMLFEEDVAKDDMCDLFGGECLERL